MATNTPKATPEPWMESVAPPTPDQRIAKLEEQVVELNEKLGDLREDVAAIRRIISAGGDLGD